MRARIFSLLFLAAVLVAASGCTAVEEVGSDVTRKFDEGLAGQGRLISPDQTADSFGSYYD